VTLAGIAAAAGAFAVTNIDDLVVLAVLFAASQSSGRPRPAAIVGGQALGFAGLVAISLAAAAGLQILPEKWLGLLGLVPLALGLRGLISAIRVSAFRHTDGDEEVVPAGNLVAVAGITFANGADNIGIYTPLFLRSGGLLDVAVTLIIFTLGLALWCVAGRYLGGHRAVQAVLGRTGHYLVPLVFIAVGVLILVQLR
jgi:cadmium resistance protein CadD (predicted permease)